MYINNRKENKTQEKKMSERKFLCCVCVCVSKRELWFVVEIYIFRWRVAKICAFVHFAR